MRRLAALPVIAFLGPVLALVTFAALQVWRIGLYDQFQRDIFSSHPTVLAPLTASRLAPWAHAASSLLAREGLNNGLALAQLRRLRVDHPSIFVGSTVLGVAVTLAAGLCLLWLATLSTRRTRWLPYEVAPDLRRRIVRRAIVMAWPWSALLGIAVGAAVWYVGFDRAGVSRTLIEGVSPSLIQAVALVAAWSVLATLVSAPFLHSAAATLCPAPLADAALCIRCRYPVRGHASCACPECGTEIRIPAAPSSRRCHTIMARGAAGLAAAFAAAASIAAASHPAPRAWLLLRFPYTESFLALAGLTSGGPPVHLEGIYGRVTFDAEHRPAEHPSQSGTWIVRWRYTPGDRGALAAGSGASTFSDRVDPAGQALTFHIRALPFGEFAFWTHPANPGYIGVGAAAPTFRPSTR